MEGYIFSLRSRVYSLIIIHIFARIAGILRRYATEEGIHK